MNKAAASCPRGQSGSIANGKSAQFPAVGWLNAYYHQPGVEILGQQGVQNEKVISIDDVLIWPAFTP